MRLKKCMEMKGNRRAIFPGGRTPKEEAILDARQDLWNRILTEYIAGNCDERGRQREGQLSDRLQRGRLKLAKHIAH